MADETIEIEGVRVLLCDTNAPALGNERDTAGLVSAALSCAADLVAIPVQRLDPGFFVLSTHVAGEMLQKFVNYRLRVAIIGDITRYLAASVPLRDFVRESNRGEAIWFIGNMDALSERLSRR